jgi:hypothetical protein
MAPSLLTFNLKYSYASPSPVGITVPVGLRIGDHRVRLLAKIDTGATDCIFQRVYADALGINVEAGQPLTMRTATGSFPVFGHEVEISCFEWTFNSVVYFPAAYEIERDVLGRSGWLQKFRLAIIDHDSVLHISHYDD